MYPRWDPGMSPRTGLLDTPNMSAGLLGPSPMSSLGVGGMSGWGGGGPGLSGNNQPGPNKMRTRVVVVKYDKRPLSNKTLFAFTESFGNLRDHLILRNKAFLEMSTHEEAMDMVNYYDQHPASLYGKPLNFYLSKKLLVIEASMDRPMDRGMDRPVRDIKGHDSKVVFFSNLPREDEDKEELLTIAGRFGIVEKHLFLTDQAFVQLGTVEDAHMLVKYYSVNPLKIKGRPIRLNICTKYKTLNVNHRQGRTGGDAQNRRSGRGNASSSPGDRTSSSRPRASSTSNSRAREERESKEEEKDRVKTEQKLTTTEEEEEVSGVTQEQKDGGEEPEGGQQEAQAPEDTADAPGDVSGADGEAKQGAESEATEAEASTVEPEKKDESTAAAESVEMEEGDEEMLDQDFMENMEDFVTLDELEEDDGEAESHDMDSTRRGGMRVVNIVGFRRGQNYLNELLGLAKPFGKVVRHLVLDLRPEAFLQFSTEEEARAMTKFYNSNVTPLVCGRPVRVNHSMSYPTIQCGASRVVYIGQIPISEYTDDAILKLAEPYGKVCKYILNRIRRECFIEMAVAEDAEKMAEEYKVKPPRINGKRLTVYVSRKYRQLKHSHRCLTVLKGGKSSPTRKSSEPLEEPPAKRSKEEEEQKEEQKEEQEEEQKEEQKEEQEEEQEEEKGVAAVQGGEVSDEETTEETSAEKIPDVGDDKKSGEDEDQQEEETETNQNGQTEAPPLPAEENRSSVATLPLPPYDPDNPIGVEHVKMGYYCRVCFLFYSNEETAKKIHCSSQQHYDKLQKYLEQNKAEKKKVKKTLA